MNLLENELSGALGPRVSFDPQIMAGYDHDLGEMPRPLTALIRTVPEAVAVPADAGDVVRVLTIASRHRVPVTPRAQATSGYGGAIPVKGGIVLDLSSMKRLLDVDAARMTVDVEPGMVWNELSKMLAKYGLDNKICPTSAPSSTVGGWFAMGGVGVGSLRYGEVRDVVLQIDVAGLDGTITTYSGADMDPFYQTCGILGVITRLRLSCREARAVRAYAAILPTARGVQDYLAALRREPLPYSVFIQSAGYLKMRSLAENKPALAERGFLAVAAVFESEADDARMAQAAAAAGGRELDAATAKHDWDDRFYPMRIKKAGPSLLVGEFTLPAERFAEAWQALEETLPGDLTGMEAVAASGGRLAILLYLLDDAGSLLYPLRMPKVMAALATAARFGGQVYSPGMWFAAWSKQCFGREKYEAVMRLKRKLDPHGLLNPGKINAPRLLGLPGLDISRMIKLGGTLAAPLSKRLGFTPAVRAETGRPS
jgi:FAD/FMN-containing dehydrogenase